jgi:hypothetical protein
MAEDLYVGFGQQKIFAIFDTFYIGRRVGNAQVFQTFVDFSFLLDVPPQ